MTRPRRAGGNLEFLDQPDLDPRELRVCLADVARLNRWFGGTRAVVAEVRRIARRCGLQGRSNVLDIGTGGADIPRALVRWGRGCGVHFHVIACDRHEGIARAAAAFCSGVPSISVIRTDALALPFRLARFDFVTCSLMIHHLAEEEVIALLRELRGFARQALIVSDLERGAWACIGTWIGTHLFCRSSYTRHDGPESVRRAYTLDELRTISQRAGCGNMRWSRRWLFRVVGVLEN
jgi:2-polyprenyl-3-methyl-5-hydroxy-6-metoxy-1,4-benzoquinol methylase